MPLLFVAQSRFCRVNIKRSAKLGTGLEDAQLEWSYRSRAAGRPPLFVGAASAGVCRW